MFFHLRHIVSIFLLVLSCFVVKASRDDIVGDTLGEKKMEKWYNQIWRYRQYASDSALVDSFKTEYGRDFWKLAALSGKLDLKDETIKYPRFIKWAVDVYNWGDRTFNTYDTAYVVGTGKKWKLQIKQDNWLDFYHLKQPENLRIGMASDLAPNIGASITYMAVSFGYSMNVDNLIAHEPVKHKRFDFSFVCSLIALDAYYNKNTGNTNINRLNDYRNYNIFKYDYKFSGLTLESYGIDMYYFFNNKKYSQGAAYSYSKYQKKSAGSAISGISLSRQNVMIDFNSLPESIIDRLPNDRRNYHIFYNDYCIMLGYGYNWVFKKNWLFNVTVIPCIGFNHSLSSNEDEAYRKDKFSMNVKTKLALVYNHNRFYYSINGRYDGHFYRAKEYQFINSFTNLAFIAGFRF